MQFHVLEISHQLWRGLHNVVQTLPQLLLHPWLVINHGSQQAQRGFRVLFAQTRFMQQLHNVGGQKYSRNMMIFNAVLKSHLRRFHRENAALYDIPVSRCHETKARAGTKCAAFHTCSPLPLNPRLVQPPVFITP